MGSRLLITGGCGLLGSSLIPVARKAEYDVTPTYHFSAPPEGARGYERLDITDEKAVHQIFSRLQPQCIVHTAGVTNVDLCESDRDFAHRVNVEATSYLAAAAREHAARLIFISADYVFDGSRGWYEESDMPSPINYYGRMKLLAEEAVLKIHKNAAVVRTSLHGRRPSGFTLSTWMLNELEAGRNLPAVSDQYSSLIFAPDLSETMLKLIESDYTGAIHMASSQGISKFEFARTLAQVFDLDETLITAVPASQITGWNAPRPRDVTLNVSRAAKLLQQAFPTIAEGLQRMKRER